MTIKSFLLYIQLHPEMVTSSFYYKEKKECTYCKYGGQFLYLAELKKWCKTKKRGKIIVYQPLEYTDNFFICDKFEQDECDKFEQDER